MFERNSLIIIQTDKGLQATVCQVGLRTCEMVYTQSFDCACNTQENIAAAVQKIQNSLNDSRIATPKDIRLSLIPSATLFREWTFPFRSRSKIKQSLTLLLGAEFPFGAGILEHRTYYAQNLPTAKNTQVITVSCAAASIQEWVDALAQIDWHPSLITFDPFPMLYGIPKSLEIQLVLHVQAKHTTVSLLENGCLRRIRYIEQGIENTKESDVANQDRPAMQSLLRDIAVVLDGIALKPTQLVLFGDCFLKTATHTALAEALDLPAVVLGQDMAYGGKTVQTGEHSTARIVAISLAQMPAWVWRLQSRCPSFHRQYHVQSPLLARYQKYIAPLCAVTLVVLCYLFSVWAQGSALHEQAQHYEAQTQAIFREAAPNARRAISMRQMRSILAEKMQSSQDAYDERTAYFILKALNNMHTVIPSSVQVRINRISFDRTRCQISGVAGSYEQVESIRQELTKITNIEEVQIIRATAQAGDDFPSLPQELQKETTNVNNKGSIAFDLALTFSRNSQ